MTLGTDVLGLSCVDVGVYITLSEIQNLLAFHFLVFSSGVLYVAKQTVKSSFIVTNQLRKYQYLVSVTKLH